ncbi:hypothetical protein Tco_0493267 [Tanacetum coccineum]
MRRTSSVEPDLKPSGNSWTTNHLQEHFRRDHVQISLILEKALMEGYSSLVINLGSWMSKKQNSTAMSSDRGSFKDGDGDGDSQSHKGVKASANSDIIFFFTSAQDGNKLLDDERLSLADDLKKAHDTTKY